jgi:hypothetical protein
MFDPEEDRASLVTDADLALSLPERLADGARLLISNRVAVIALRATLAFPLLLLVTGATGLASGPVVFQLFAALPALALLGLVCAVARHAFLLGVRGVDDSADLPSLKQLVHEAPQALADVGLVAVAVVAPAALAFWLGVPVAGGGWLALAVVFVPMLLALRAGGETWRDLRPARVLRAVFRNAKAYLPAALVVALLVAPAVGTVIASLGGAVFVTAALPGPLFVGPVIVAAHVLGLTLRQRGTVLAELSQHLGTLRERSRATRASSG